MTCCRHITNLSILDFWVMGRVSRVFSAMNCKWYWCFLRCFEPSRLLEKYNQCESMTIALFWCNWTRQLADTAIHPQCFFTDSRLNRHDHWPTRQVTDTIFLKKSHRLTRRTSPTVTIPGKWMKENRSDNHKVSLFVKADKKIPSVGIIFCFRHHYRV